MVQGHSASVTSACHFASLKAKKKSEESLNSPLSNFNSFLESLLDCDLLFGHKTANRNIADALSASVVWLNL